jgi:serine/threonine-protein kinase
MATVFLAHDLKHDRPVALKVLHPELAASLGPDRFQREIRLAARLQHPHILSVHDSGETAGQLWFTMPFVEGESLRHRLARERQLPLEDALSITREAALALEYAHEHGVIHRDIKPENILLTKDGSTLVADFGIARGVSGDSEQLTETGLSVGTPTYMSPEQAAGERALDGRTDIYSLGIVLYEMLAGEPPYTGATLQVIVARRLSEAPRPLRAVRETIPEAIEQAVQKALAKTPADRFTTAAQLAQALTFTVTTPAATPTIVPVATPSIAQSLRAQTAAELAGARELRRRRRVPIGLATLGVGFLLGLGVLFAWRRTHAGSDVKGPKHLAVLPFENQGDSADAYFADGITDELRGKLAAVPGLEVVAGRSSNKYRQTTKDLPDIARDLGVEYLLVGKIHWAKGQGASRVRVSPELIWVRAGAAPTTKWQQPFDAALTDVFQVQADIAGRVAQALNVALGSGASQALAARPTKSPEAYDLYLRANEYFNRNNKDDNEIAVELNDRAIRLDSGFALAWAKLAQSHAGAYWQHWDPSPQRLTLAKQAAQRALALQPDLPEAHLAMGFYHYWGHRDYDRALAEFAVTQRMQPNNVDAIEAVGLVERRQGKWQEALASMRRAVELDPLNYSNLVELAGTYMLIRDYGEGAQLADRAIALAPDVPGAYGAKALIYLNWVGNLEQVRNILREALRYNELGRVVDQAPTPAVMVLATDSTQRSAILTLGAQSFGKDVLTYFEIKARVYDLNGDVGPARTYYDSLALTAKAELKEQPDEALTHAALGVAQAHLGHRDSAIREGRRAVELLPLTKDAYFGTIAQALLAEVYMVVGQPDEAIDQLHALLLTPSVVSRAGLKVSPIWAPLRGNPHFEQLVSGQ